MQLAGAVLVYVGIGYLLDWWLGTSPWFLIAGAVVGMVAFFVQLVRVVRQMNQAAPRKSGRPYREWSEEDAWDKPDAWEREDREWKKWPDEDGK